MQALVDHRAREAGIRCLAIKGPALDATGIRQRHVSNDVDVLVHPDDLDRLAEELERAGLTRQVSTRPEVSQHSTTLRADALGCEVDVHARFPGFLADPAAAFDALWDCREEVVIARVPVITCSRAAHAAVSVLHLLRDPEARAAELQAALRTVTVTLSDSEVQDLVSLAGRTGAATSLAPLLDQLGAQADPRHERADLRADWILRTRTGVQRGIVWLQGLQRSPVRTWPSLILRAGFLTDEEIKAQFPEASTGRWGLMRSRLRRIAVGLGSMFSALATFWRARAAARRLNQELGRRK